MPRPATLTDAVELVRKSGLIDDGVTDEFAARANRRRLAPESFFARMVDEELLTPFQARQLTEGRWRGLVLGHYHLQARIGRGGMGQVFRADDRKHGRPVAIKVLNIDLADDALAKARLVREAHTTAKLDHPNIVKVYDLAAEHSPPYMVMEYVDGLSLQAIVALTGTLRIEATALCGRQIALGLAHAAAAGLVHRDVKPANLLLDRFGVVKILDLGIVLSLEDAAPLTLFPDGQSPMLGTVDYLAPEQALDSHGVDGRADIYALGGTLYFLLAGQPPFDEGGPQLRLRRKQASEPPPVHRLRPDIPEALSAVIAKMLALHPDDRYQCALDAADALAPWAVPVAGFPEDLFARVPGGDGSGEFPAQSRSSVFRQHGPAHRGRSDAYGSSVHPALAMTLSAVLSPTEPEMPLFRDVDPALTITPPPHLQPTRLSPALPASVEPIVVLRERIAPRRRYGIIAAVCLTVLILCFALAWAIGVFAGPVVADAAINRGPGTARSHSARVIPCDAPIFPH